MKTKKIIYSILLLFLLLNVGYTKEKSYILSNGMEIKLQEPNPNNVLDRLPGPSHGFSTGCGFCLMCQGNHLLSQHNISQEHLAKIGYSQWTTLHDNLHNNETFMGHTSGNSYGYGYNLSYPPAGPTSDPPSLFAPTPIDVLDKTLTSAQLTKNDVLYDLGCGDGRVLIVTSKLIGCRTVGLDIDKDCVEQSNTNVKLNKLDDLIRIYERDITDVEISQATAVFIYIQPELSVKLKYLQNIPLVIAHDKPIPQLKSPSVLNIFSKEDKRTHKIYYWKRTYSNGDYL